MADHNPPHHHHHRPNRISLPPRATAFSPSAAVSSTPRAYPLYPLPPAATPAATPSKHRLSSLNSFRSRSSSNRSSLSFLLLILLSLRSLYSLLPFLRSSTPSFSLFPFTFLVSLLSFFISIAFSLLPNQNLPSLALPALSHSQLRLLLFKSLILAVVFLIRFQALRYCGTAAMILAELSGGVAARFFSQGHRPNGNFNLHSSKVRGFFVLFLGLFLLSLSWDRTGCFPFAATSGEKFAFSLYPREACLRIWPMVLPFLSGFLGCYERVSMNGVGIRQLGRKRVRLISLLFATVLLFVPAVVSFSVVEGEGDGITFANLGWPLANTVVFGVLLSENYTDDRLASSKDFRREFLATFCCTVVLELFYFPELSLGGLMLCGSLLYFAVRELDPVYTDFLELGVGTSESLGTLVMKPIRHILSERKSRKIALFLLINTAYMVVEFVAGFMSNSLGLISDACHMLFDCAALAIGLYASYISRLPANNQFNYGRGRFEVLSGYANAVFLVLVGALIVLESFERILDPQEISTKSLLAVSIGGLVVNVVGLIFFHEEHHHAHGGSCSNSHAHSHSQMDLHHNHQHSHNCAGHDHESHENCNELVTVSNECLKQPVSSHKDHQGHLLNSFDSHRENYSKELGCCDHNNCAHNHGHHSHAHNHKCSGNHGKHNEAITVSSECHEMPGSGHEDHQGHLHGTVDSHRENDWKEHAGHDHSNSVHNHGHNGHTHSHSHHGLAHQQEPHDHGCQPGKVSSNGKEAGMDRHHHIDHNMEGIFLHVLADTMGSVGVVISTLLIKYKGWLVADPACSIFISILIVSSVIPLLRNSAEILLQRIPRAHEHSIKRAISEVIEMKGVRGIRNLHIWSFTNTDVVGAIHLHISPEADEASMRAEVTHILRDAGIKDLTLQLEYNKQ